MHKVVYWPELLTVELCSVNKNLIQYIQVVVLPSFGVPMVSASPLPSDAMGSVGDVLMVVMKSTAVRLLDAYIFFE